MSHRPALDVISFQKLLNAAWVIQCERDRELSAARARTALDMAASKIDPLPVIVPLPLDDQVVVAPGFLSGARPTATAKAIDLVIPSPSTPLPPMASLSMAAPMCSPSEVAGALALAPYRPWPPKKKDPILFPATTLKKPAWGAILVSGIALRAKLALAHLKAKEISLPRLKVIIPQSTTRAARAYSGPVVVLLIVLVFVLFQMFSHRAGLTSVKASTEPTSAMLQDSWGSKLESSHLRVTDPAASSAVEDLSRYEMRTVRRQAEYGDVEAALTLGMAYEVGKQTPQNCTQAAHWITVAAEEGNAAAQYNLALRYANGDGTPKDPEEAEKWLQTAARNGDQQAAMALREDR